MAEMDKELEQKLWTAADYMRGNISSEQYMHIVIGIMFIKSMSDKYTKAVEAIKEEYGAKWEFFAENKDILSSKYNCSFIIPKKARWEYISQYATQEEIGSKIDKAFLLIEESNHVLKGLFDKNYNREELDQNKLGNVVSEFSNIDINKYGDDIFGRIYEYFLGQFFLKQGQKGGEFYTPACIVKLLVELIEPKKGTLYDPACGTGGMFVQAKKHLEDIDEDSTSLTIYGQEYQDKTWKLARINLLLQGFNAQDINLGDKSADSFKNDHHKGKTFDYILANPPFNQKKWGLEELEDDPRWQWGLPPKNNANYAWLSHMLSKLNSNGKAAVVLANGSLSGSQKNEVEFRKKVLEGNKVEMIISLPDKLFYTTGIPVSVWVFNNSKSTEEVLFVDASNVEGTMVSKKLRKFEEEDISKIKEELRKFRNGEQIEELGFSKSVTKEEIKESDYSFVPGRYVGFVKEEIDEEKLKEEIKESSKELKKLFSEFNNLIPEVEKAIEKAINYTSEKE
ncbi:MAG: N-6 DNA methylase [Mycoplasmatales bacterium]